jgi:hypothetical protein
MTVHFVLRVPAITRIRGLRPLDTVEAHNEAAKKVGRVALAKFGQPGTAKRCELLTHQIKAGIETLLLLVVKRGTRFYGFQSSLTSVYYGRQNEKLLTAAPAYYRDLNDAASLWFIVDHPFEACDLKTFRLSTNGRPLLDVVSECRTSSMLVEKIS